MEPEALDNAAYPHGGEDVGFGKNTFLVCLCRLYQLHSAEMPRVRCPQRWYLHPSRRPETKG